MHLCLSSQIFIFRITLAGDNDEGTLFQSSNYNYTFDDVVSPLFIHAFGGQPLVCRTVKNVGKENFNQGYQVTLQPSLALPSYL